MSHFYFILKLFVLVYLSMENHRDVREVRYVRAMRVWDDIFRYRKLPILRVHRI